MLNILLIDDDDMEYALIKRMLSDCYDAPYMLRYANTLEKGVSILKNQPINIILLDDKLHAGQTSKVTVPLLKQIADNVPMVVISSNIDAAYLKDKTILDVYDIVDKYHLRQKIKDGLLAVD
jgi:DNA-binding NtrC family response regulator